MGRCLQFLKVLCFALGTALAVGWASWLLSSCHSVRRIESVSTSVIKDSVVNDSTRAVSRVDSNVHSHIERDSAIGISGGHVGMSFPALEPPLTDAFGTSVPLLKTGGELPSGFATPFVFDSSIKQGNLKLHIYKGGDGRMHADCDADSLTIVVNKLVRDRDFISHRFDSLQFATTYKMVSDSTATLKTVTEAEHKGWKAQIGAWLWNLMAVVGCGFVLVFSIKSLINRLS